MKVYEALPLDTYKKLQAQAGKRLAGLKHPAERRTK